MFESSWVQKLSAVHVLDRRKEECEDTRSDFTACMSKTRHAEAAPSSRQAFKSSFAQ